MSSAASEIDILKSMTIDERIAAVAKDVVSKSDRYANIKPFKLAELLGIPDAECPGDDWHWVAYLRPVPAEVVLDEEGVESALELLEETLTPERIAQLTQ